MADALYVTTVLVAFAAFVGFVRLCDRVVRSDQQVPPAVSSPDEAVDR